MSFDTDESPLIFFNEQEYDNCPSFTHHKRRTVYLIKLSMCVLTFIPRHTCNQRDSVLFFLCVVVAAPLDEHRAF